MKDLYLEQPIVLNTLKNMIKKGHVPHALIFYGDKSVSKKEVAIEFVKLLYADYFNTTVSESVMTKKIDDNSTSNLKFIKRDTKTSISVDNVRDYIKEANETSLEEGPRVFVFEDADNLNLNSSNAILKFVEEPMDGVYIIFLVENLSNLLDTIKSRCAILSFKPLNKELVKSKLIDEGLDKDILNVLIEYTQDEDELKSIFKNEDGLKIYNLVTDMFLEKFDVTGSLIIYLKEHYDLLSSSEKEDMFISLFILYLRDILSFNIKKNEELLVFKAEIERIKKIASLYIKEEIEGFIKEALDIKSCIINKKPINVHLYLDNLLLKIECVLRK